MLDSSVIHHYMHCIISLFWFLYNHVTSRGFALQCSSSYIVNTERIIIIVYMVVDVVLLGFTNVSDFLIVCNTDKGFVWHLQFTIIIVWSVHISQGYIDLW